MKKGISKYIGKFVLGQTIGLWTVISEGAFPEKEMYKSYCVKVMCKCGHEAIIPCSRFSVNRSRGCQHCRVWGSGSYLWKGIGEISGKMLTQIKNSAKIRNIEYKISNDYLWKLYLGQDKKCLFTGLELVHSNDKKINTASLDRLDSSIGYIEGNIAWVHKHINIMKNQLNTEEFLNYCERIYGQRNKIRSRITNRNKILNKNRTRKFIDKK